MRRGIGTGEAKREEVCSKFSWFSEWHSLWVVVVVVPTGVRGCEKTNSRPSNIRRGMSVGSMRDVGRGDGRLQLQC